MNRLVTTYNKHNQNNDILTNNLLLQNNQQLHNNQHVNMMRMQKQQQNDPANKELLRQAVIKPTKIKQDNTAVNETMKIIDQKYGKKMDITKDSTVKEFWNKRTNQPYKNILKNENYNKEFKDEKDLIVHKITQADKDENVIENEFTKKQSTTEQHNNELKLIYSTNKQNEHKQKFEYAHVYKYQTIEETENTSQINNKQDRIKIYKKLQKEEETGKKNKDDILNAIFEEGIFTKEELANISTVQTFTPINPDSPTQKSTSQPSPPSSPPIQSLPPLQSPKVQQVVQSSVSSSKASPVVHQSKPVLKQTTVPKPAPSKPVITSSDRNKYIRK